MRWEGTHLLHHLRALGLLTGTQSPLSQLPRMLLGLLPRLSLSAPPAPLFVVLIDRRLSPGCQGSSHAPARAHGRTRVRRQAARGLPLYIMQPLMPSVSTAAGEQGEGEPLPFFPRSPDYVCHFDMKLGKGCKLRSYRLEKYSSSLCTH